MYLKIIIKILTIIFLVIFQNAFMENLPGIFAEINPIIVILVFLSGLGDFKSALWLAAGAGFLLDIYSFNVFGLYLLGLSAVTIFINFLQTNFFTNRSLYSFLALTFFAVLGYDLAIRIFAGTASLVLDRNPYAFGFGAGFIANEPWRLLINLIAAAAVFYAVNFATAKLKPIFLLKHK
jgi:rod shape-determining protein MreD